MSTQTVSPARQGRVGPSGVVVMTAAQIDADEQQWHRMRATGVTATDARVLSGHGYADETVIGRWRKKVYAEDYIAEREEEDRGDSLLLEMGIIVEPKLRQLVAHRLGVKTRRVGLVAHKDHRWLLADPDGATSDGGGVELKRTGDRYLSKWDDYDAEPMPISDTGRVLSPAWFTQVQHQMLVTGWPHVHVAAHERDYDRLHLWRVERNQLVIDRLTVLAEVFWQHVVAETVPPIEWDTVTAAEVKARYPSVDREELVVTDASQARQWLAEHDALKAQIKSLETVEKQLATKMRALAGDAAAVIDGATRQTLWTHNQQSRTGFDQARFAADHPELAKQYATRSTYRVLRPNPKALAAPTTTQKDVA